MLKRSDLPTVCSERAAARPFSLQLVGWTAGVAKPSFVLTGSLVLLEQFSGVGRVSAGYSLMAITRPKTTMKYPQYQVHVVFTNHTELNAELINRILQVCDSVLTTLLSLVLQPSQIHQCMLL